MSNEILINIGHICPNAKAAVDENNNVFVKRLGVRNPTTGKLQALPWNSLVPGDDVSLYIVFDDNTTGFLTFQLADGSKAGKFTTDKGSEIIPALISAAKQEVKKLGLTAKGFNVLLGEKKPTSNEGNDEIPF